MTQINIADPLQPDWSHGRWGGTDQPALPLSGPIPCLRGGPGDPDAVANDNAPHCRRSGVAIDPMFLN